MAKDTITRILCFDDHKALVTTGILEDVRRRFADASRYKVLTFSDRESFLGQLGEKKEANTFRVTILGVHDQEEHFEIVNTLMIEIRQADPETGLILLVPRDKTERIKQIVSITADAYIPKNDNAILRIHNIIKRLTGQRNLDLCMKRRNISLVILFAFIGLSLLLLLISSLFLPEYF